MKYHTTVSTVITTLLILCVFVAVSFFVVFELNIGSPGYLLLSTLEEKLEKISENVALIEKIEPEVAREYRENLEQKIEDLLGNAEFDRSRVLTEVAIFADKAAIDEETVRLRSHIKEFSKTLESDAPVGNKLDFILQEMNREINTTGSKANNIEISRIVIDVKSELEKIREQIQNIE